MCDYNQLVVHFNITLITYHSRQCMVAMENSFFFFFASSKTIFFFCIKDNVCTIWGSRTRSDGMRCIHVDYPEGRFQSD